MPAESPDIERHLLDFLLSGRFEIQSFNNLNFVHSIFPGSSFITEDNYEEVQQALWRMISRGLVYLRLGGQSSGVWTFQLTKRGRNVALSDDPDPDDPNGYMSRILKVAPKTSEKVKLYLSEAVSAYDQRLYIASMVMLGVAAEACTLETAKLYADQAGATSLQKLLETEKPYVRKLTAFRDCLHADKSNSPERLRDGLVSDVVGLLEIIRQTRNDAGHPTGTVFEREDCNSRLQFYAAVHKKLYLLQAHLSPP